MEREPTNSENCDVFCTDCAGEWHSALSGLYYNASTNKFDRIEHIYFIGKDNVEVFMEGDRLLEKYTCPNGCGSTILRHDETHTATPWQRWRKNQVTLEIMELESKLRELENELHDLGDY